MKLYDVQRNTDIILRDDEGHELKLKFHHIDGAYSYCTDSHGNVVHIAAWADVEVAA